MPWLLSIGSIFSRNKIQSIFNRQHWSICLFLFQIKTLSTKKFLRSFTVHDQNLIMFQTHHRLSTGFTYFIRFIEFRIGIWESSFWRDFMEMNMFSWRFSFLNEFVMDCMIWCLVRTGWYAIFVEMLASIAWRGLFGMRLWLDIRLWKSNTFYARHTEAMMTWHEN